MANPNIVSASAVYGKTTGLSVTTSETTMVSNASNSGKIYKINTLIVSNVDGANAADITVRYWAGSTPYSIAYTVPVPADAALVVISRDNQIYLQENSSLRLYASASSDLQAVCSWEEIN